MFKRKFSKVDWPSVDANPLEFLVAPEALSTFKSEVWERHPKLYKADAGKEELFDDLCSLEQLYNVLDGGFTSTDPGLNFGEDINAARYRDGIRETLNGKKGNMKTVMRLFEDEGCTIQLHQPQRFSDPLWRLIAALEKQLGCLVGSNAYHTPAGTQGLAPHYDDVDLWVCQTMGSKQWRIYKSPEGYQLPACSSTDFQQSELGEPVLEATLEVGDVLYMPRGTIHQAVAQDDNSVHVTISTYQKWALADFAVSLIQELQAGKPSTQGRNATPLVPLELRKGLPMNFLGSAGLQYEALAKGKARPTLGVATQAAGALRALAEHLEKDASLTTATADRMAIDFYQNRSPPFPETLPPRGSAPEMSSKVKSLGSSYFRISPCEPSPEVTEAYADSSDFLSVISCLKNDRETHMMGDAYKLADWYGRPFKGHSDAEEEDSEDDDSDEGDEEDEDPERDQDGNGQVIKQQKVLQKQKAGNRNGDLEASKKKKLADEEEIDLGSQDESDEDEDEDEDEGEEDGPGQEEGPNTLVFPASYAEALAQILIQDRPVAVKDIPLKDKEERLGLAYSLWAEGFVTTAVASKPQPSLKKQKN